MLATYTENTFKALLDSAPDAMVIVDENGKIELVNHQTEKMFGYSREELMGLDVEVLMPMRYHKSHHVKKREFVSSPEVREMGSGMELYAMRKDGSEFLVEIALSYLKTERQTNVCAAIRDISEKKASENKFKALLESAPDAMVIADSEGKIELVNSQTEKLFGYLRHEMVGKDVEMLIPKRYREEHKHKKNSFIHAPEVREMGTGIELFAQRKDGTEFLVEIALSYLRTDLQTSVCAAIRDISDRKLLEKQKAQLASIVEFSNDAIIGKSPGRIITSWNKGAADIFGYSSQEVIGKHINIIIPPENIKEAEDLITLVLAGEITQHKETVLMKKNGERFVASLTCSPVKDGEGNITGISKIVRDITQMKQNQEEISKLNREKHLLEEKLLYHKQLEDFAYITSHNLRSPVGNLSSLFVMYDQQTEADSRNTIVSKLRTVTGHLTNTLNELSKALSIKTDMGIERQKLFFEDIFKVLTESCDAEILSTGSTITTDFSKCPYLHYPKVYLESILLNFLTNAMKYRSPVRTPHIIFETYENQTEGKVLRVTDNGLGIDMKRHGKKVFGLHKTFHRNDDAKGVGLFITKAQIEAMGGSVTVESEVDKGSVFTVYFSRPNKNLNEQP